MKSFKRKLAGFLIFAMMLGIMAPGMTVQAANNFEIRYDFEEQTATIEKVSGSSLNFDSVRYAATKTDGGTPAEKDWNDAPGGIDLSWIAPKKDAYGVFEVIASGGAVKETLKLALKAQRTDLGVALINEDSADKVSVSKKLSLSNVTDDCTLGGADTGYLVFYTAEKGASTGKPVSFASIEMKKGANGNWKALTNYSDDTMKAVLEKCLAKGTTLYFRIKADNANALWASKEVKFSYKKQANAPKAKLDISKHTTGLKAGQEYRLSYVSESTAFTSNWIFVDTEASHHEGGTINATKVTLKKTGIQVQDLIVTGVSVGSAAPVSETASSEAVGGNTSSGGAVDGNPSGGNTTTGSEMSASGPLGARMYAGGWTMEVRTAATAGKVPSKVAKYSIVTKDEVSKAAIEITLVDPADKKKGLQITNKTGEEIQYTLLTTGTSIDGATKWTTIKKDATKPSSFKKNFVKGATGLNETDTIYVRKAGTKATKTADAVLAGNYVSYLVSDFKQTAVKGVTGTAVSTGASVTPSSDKKAYTVAFTKTEVSGAAADLTATFTVEFDNAKVESGNATAITTEKKNENSAVVVDVKTVAGTDDVQVSVTMKKATTELAKNPTYTFEHNGIEITVEVKLN